MDAQARTIMHRIANSHCSCLVATFKVCTIPHAVAQDYKTN